MTPDSYPVGILALQGDYQKHRQVLEALSVPSTEVRRPDDFDRIGRLIVPGGESTTILELLGRLKLEEPFQRFITTRPVWGTCAGMVLLAATINNSTQKVFGAIDIAVDRNGYGRQYFSTVAPARFSLNGCDRSLDLVFIRAPRVTRVGSRVQVLLTWNGDPVLLAQDKVLVSSFHPELSGSTALHEYFVRKFHP